MPFASEIDNLRLIYGEIIDGFSIADGSRCLIKHLNDLENIEVLRYKTSQFKHHNLKLPSQEEKLQMVIKNGEWSQAKEEEILTYKYNISDNEKNLRNIIPQQQEPIKKIIGEIRKKLSILLHERNIILGQTADSFADRDSFNYLIYMSIYKSKTAKLWDSFDEFADVDEDKIIEYGQMLEKCITKFSNTIINEIAVMPFFLNPFSYCKKNIHNFLQKPLIEVTNYQSALFSMGMRNLSIIEAMNNEGKDAPEMHDDIPISEIVKKYDIEYSILLGKSKSASR